MINEPFDLCYKSGFESREYSHLNMHDDICGLPSKKENSISSFNTASWRSTSRNRYEYDIFLVYDKMFDSRNAEDVMRHVHGSHCNGDEPLRILDFGKDATPGIPSNRFFAQSLNRCQYTCLVVSRNFLDDLWMRFSADMAIQNMLQDENKQFTLIIIVMDFDLKLNQLPLEFQTLSPILCRERYFENRLSKAFVPPFFPSKSSSANYQTSPPSCPSTRPYASCPGNPIQESHIASSTPSKQRTYHSNLVPSSFNSSRDFPSSPAHQPPRSKSDINLPGQNMHHEAHALEHQDWNHKSYPQFTNTIRSDVATIGCSDTRSLPCPSSSPQLKMQFHNPSNTNDVCTYLKKDLKIDSKQSPPLSLLQQSASTSNSPTTSRTPQEHCDSSTNFNHLTTLSNVTFEHQTSVVGRSTGMRHPVELDDETPCPVDLYSSDRLESEELKETGKYNRSDASVTLLEEDLAPGNFDQTNTSQFSGKKLNGANTEEDKPIQGLTRIENTVTARFSNHGQSSDSINSLDGIEVEISEKAISEKSTSSLSFIEKIKSKFTKS